MPGAHEFAMKPAPAGRNSRKASLVPKEDDARSHVVADTTSKAFERSPLNGTIPESAVSPTTPTTRESFLITPVPPSPPLAPTPTAPTSPIPSTSTSNLSSSASQPPKTPTTPSNPTVTTAPLETTPAPTPNRPAPPSPNVSRRVSSISSTSGRSLRSSRPPSRTVSRAGSTRKSAAQQQQLISTPSKVPITSSSPLPSPRSFAFAVPLAGALAASTPRVLIHIRDFAYPRTDERFRGLGADIPRANRVARLNRRLRPGSGAGSQSSGDDEREDDEDDEDTDAAWDMLRHGWKGAGFVDRGGASGAPSQAEMDWNFRDGAEEEEEEEEEDDGEGETPLWPGLYRALYAFQPEGTAEMALEEDQLVRVVGRGGGVGWAVVVDESADTPDTHALVPEGYLTPVRMDWEDEEEA
ncbi:hypothetical protein DXG03_006672 [Asterophora parasitica]|uniref:SH3 domain-containing protein n=1 Tax=Asterophora parasitica TaxID=117018 RepID=A0A9P7FZH9_9AGAR|nr:hypothetical protein DXG03_006672 [Asterophora parasitica]